MGLTWRVGGSIFGGVVSSSSDENRVQQARNPPAGFFYIREKRRMYDVRRVLLRLRVLQPWLPSGGIAAVDLCLLVHRRQKRQIAANACVLEAFCVAGVVEYPGTFYARRRFFRARVLTLLYGE